MLRPDELWAAWCWGHLMERCGEMTPAEARRWKDGVYGLMQLWGLEPDDVLTERDETTLVRNAMESQPVP